MLKHVRILKSKWQNNNIMSVNIIIIYHYHGAGRPSRTTFLCSTKLSELHIIHWRILHFYSWVWQSYLSDVVYIHRLTSLSIQTSILRDSFWRTWNFFLHRNEILPTTVRVYQFHSEPVWNETKNYFLIFIYLFMNT